jgi:hypothetical protein
MLTGRYESGRSGRDVIEVPCRFSPLGTETNVEKGRSHYTVSQAWEWANLCTTPEHGNAFFKSGVSKAWFPFASPTRTAIVNCSLYFLHVFFFFPFSIAHFYFSFTFFNKVCCVLLLRLNFNLCKKCLPLFRLYSYLAIFFKSVLFISLS